MYLIDREAVILVGFAPDEEETIRASIETARGFQVAGSYRTYREALDLLKSVCVRFVLLSCALSDMPLSKFIQEANRQFDVYAAFVVPEGVTKNEVSYLAIEAINSGKVVNFVNAPVTCQHIDQIQESLLFYRMRDRVQCFGLHSDSSAQNDAVPAFI